MRGSLKVGACIVVAATILPSSMSLADQTGGWVPMRIEDGVGGHCIDRKSEVLTILWKKAVVNKFKGWFSEDKSISLNFVIDMEGQTGGTFKSVSFPRSYSQTMQGAPDGKFIVGQEADLMDEYPLKKGTDQVTNFTIGMSIGNQQGDTVLTDVMKSVIADTTKLPLSSAVLSAMNEFNSIGSDILNTINQDNSLSATDNGALSLLGSFELKLSPKPEPDPSDAHKCKDGGEASGSLAYIDGNVDGVGSNGVINIAQPYCFRLRPDGSFWVQYSKAAADGKCSAPPGPWTDLGNPFVVLMVNADTPSAVNTQSVMFTANEKSPKRRLSLTKPSKESIARCQVFGIPADKCDIDPRIAKFVLRQ